MAWFRNFYGGPECGWEWEDEWSCQCDDDCPNCGFRHVSPDDSDNLGTVIEKFGEDLTVSYSPPSAGHAPDYREFASVKSPKLAKLLAEAASDLTYKEIALFDE